jgi:nucleotide-binding universal stress UspA family protein
MPTPNKILLAVDFSTHSDVAAEDAFALAAKFGAQVHLLHVFALQDKPEPRSDQALHAERALLRQKLDALAEAQRASRRVAEVIWREGDPAWTIVNTAEQHRVDWIVLGASGRGGMTRFVLGSVAESVTKNATCSVLIVRGPRSEHDY